MLPNFSKKLFAANSQKSAAQRRAERSFRPRLESLEARQMLSTVWVDANPADRTAHPNDFSTIGAAVAAAHAGDTIEVAPGQYIESVAVNKTLTILGGQPRLAGETGSSELLTGSTGFALAANSVEVKGFRIEGSLGATGIATDAAHSGYQILDNIFASLGVGIDLNSATNSTAKTSTVSGNQFTADVFGLADGIVSDKGLRNATISNNTFLADTDASMLLTAASQNVQILNNTVEDATISVANTTNSKIDGNSVRPLQPLFGDFANGIVVNSGVTKTEIARNTVVDCGAGIVLEAGATSNQVTNNTVVGVLNGDQIGILLDGAAKNTVSGNTISGVELAGIALIDGATGNTVTNNKSSNNFGSGISLDHANGNTVSQNTTNQNGRDGIVLFSSNQNTVSSNTANNNGNDGIHVDANSSNNIVKTNTALNNSVFDLEDDTTGGTGTAGTKNTWSGNTANKKHPAGLH